MKNENGKWLKTELKSPQTGVQINGLSIGDVVYARVTDGTNIFDINDGTSVYTFNITELEDYSKTYETKTKYFDSNKEIAIIPTGFAVNNLHNEIKEGILYDYSVNYKTKSYVKSTESVLGNTTKNREVNLHNYTYTFYGKCEKAKKQ